MNVGDFEVVIGLLHIWDEGVELGLVVRDCVGWIKNLTMFGVGWRN